MRTDVYLVVQELTGCKNLFGDATDNLRYLTGRLTRSSGKGRPNPVNDLPPAERRPVRLYSAFVVAGCAALVPLSAFYGLPIEIGVYLRAIRELAHGLSSSRLTLVADSTGVLIVSVTFQALLVRALFRTYRAHLRRLLRLAGWRGEAASPG